MQTSSSRITVVIPVRGDNQKNEGCHTTTDSLARQTYQGFKVVIVPDQGKGAAWARNEGFKQCDTEFVLFSDNDIEWKEHALESMLECLTHSPRASYCYGRYEMGGIIVGHQLFAPRRLLYQNYISTMSLIRAADFPGFDESIKRFQDWDLWLTLLAKNKRGVYCNDLIFTTAVKPGISHGNAYTIEMALKVLNDKHKLNLPQFADDFVA